MGFLRFIFLLVIVLVAYFAQYIFDHGTLNQFFPTWLLEQMPSLSRLYRWLPEDLLTLAFAGTALSAIFFGLITPAWPSTHGLSYVSAQSKAERHSSVATVLALICEVIAFLATAIVVVVIYLGVESSLLIGAWIGSWGVALAAAWMMKRARSLQVVAVTSSAPERSWPTLLFILICAGLLFSYRWLTLPAVIPTQVAELGLLATQLSSSAPSEIGKLLFGQAQTSWPILSLATMGLTIRFTGDALLALRLSGALTTLLLIVATWLAGCETFRRLARVGTMDELIEDDGRFPATLAAAVVLVTVAVLHFGRLPIFLEPAMWGAFSLWALLRGLRGADSVSLVLAGLCAGLAAMAATSGLTILVVSLLVWVGMWLLPGIGFPRAFAVVKQWGWALWLLGLLMAVAPMLGLWLNDPSRINISNGSLAGRLAANLINNLWGFHWKADVSAQFGYPNHLIDSLLAPFLLLAIGGLLLNLDRLPGWLLIVWLSGGLVTISALATQSPDWLALLPLLPAAALAISFALDRARSTMIESMGGWVATATIYCAAGLIAWAGIHNGLAYLTVIDALRDPASEVGFFLHDVKPESPVVLIDMANGVDQLWQQPAVQLLKPPNLAAAQQLVAKIGEWPNALPAGSHLLLLPPIDPATRILVEQSFPSAQMTVRRSVRGNPVLYVFTLP